MFSAEVPELAEDVPQQIQGKFPFSRKDVMCEGPAAVTTYTYDADGNPARVENTDSRNPLADRCVYTYDADGNVVSEEISEFPRDIVLWAVSHTYDSGNVIRTEYDSLADGSASSL